ncbi:MAG: TetR/AcrR family transcriptional regulator [Actinomycetota bacterium]
MAQASQETVRARNPRGEGARLRTDLLDAAAELMARHGSIDKVSVRAVAAATGVSPTAVYRHFDNHAELLWAAVNHCFEEFAAAMLEARASTEDVYEQLVRSGETYVRFATEHRGKYRVMFSNRVELPPREEPVGTYAFDHLIDLIASILAERGDDRDPTFVAVQVWTWIHGIVDLIGNHAEFEFWPDVVPLLAEMRERLELTAPS